MSLLLFQVSCQVQTTKLALRKKDFKKMFHKTNEICYKFNFALYFPSKCNQPYTNVILGDRAELLQFPNASIKGFPAVLVMYD